MLLYMAICIMWYLYGYLYNVTMHGDLYYEVCVTVFVILLCMAICIMRYV